MLRPSAHMNRSRNLWLTAALVAGCASRAPAAQPPEGVAVAADDPPAALVGPEPEELRAVPCPMTTWAAPQMGGVDPRLISWADSTPATGCTVDPSGGVGVCAVAESWFRPGDPLTVSPADTEPGEDETGSWFVVWVVGEPQPRRVIRVELRAPSDSADAFRFSVAQADLDHDGDEELLISGDHVYNTIGSRWWNTVIVESLESNSTVAFAGSYTFEPEEFLQPSLLTTEDEWTSAVMQFFELRDERCSFHRRVWETGPGGTASGPVRGERQLFRYRNGRLDATPTEVIVDHPQQVGSVRTAPTHPL